MFKVLCLLAIVAVVSAGISPAHPSTHQPRLMKREAVMEPEEPGKEPAVEGQDDMDKAETFGFGYHKVFHVYPSYYPSYYGGYHGYGYPSYYPNYYNGYYY
ncbi:AGAP006984-PA-like protein [Anopheles sinensis]|uniref:AGAP006984-PA-like protein n=1 Tax=Anopheles sinensis TaxID=74873 RepID=A0A084WRN8_ANOSI|nr:AGAP006984-PA-like protein [Anopheles sinensis]